MVHEVKHTATYIVDDGTKNYHKAFELKDSATKEQAKNLALGYENFLQTPDEHYGDFITHDLIDLDD